MPPSDSVIEKVAKRMAENEQLEYLARLKAEGKVGPRASIKIIDFGLGPIATVSDPDLPPNTLRTIDAGGEVYDAIIGEHMAKDPAHAPTHAPAVIADPCMFCHCSLARNHEGECKAWFSFFTSLQVGHVVAELTKTGLFGKDENATVEELLRRAIRTTLEENPGLAHKIRP